MKKKLQIKQHIKDVQKAMDLDNLYGFENEGNKAIMLSSYTNGLRWVLEESDFIEKILTKPQAEQKAQLPNNDFKAHKSSPKVCIQCKEPLTEKNEKFGYCKDCYYGD